MKHLAIGLALAAQAVVGDPAPAGTGEFGAYAASTQWTMPTDPAVLAKLQQWQDQKVGLLIHWGPYSQWGIVESWSLVTTRHPWNQRPAAYAQLDDRAYQVAYEDLVATFNPTNFQPARWAAAARGAGVRYMFLTTKHHDGFCMWDTTTTPYRVTGPRCPFRTNPQADLLRATLDAFRAEGLRTGLYFSKADWHHPGYWIPERGPGSGQGPNYKPAEDPARWQSFKDFTWQQVEELVSKYGPQDVLWLDGGAVRPPHADIDMDGLAARARQHQPGLLMVDRTVHGRNENYITPEGEIPARFLPYPWETCMTMGTKWTWKPDDTFKSTGTLIRNLCRIVARNGNYLIGIGPDGAGEFDPTVYQRLQEIGAWLARNGDAIYETRPLPPYEQGDVVFTHKRDGTRFAIVLAKDDHSGAPSQVTVPPEFAAPGDTLEWLGGGSLTVGPAGLVSLGQPVGAHAWALKRVVR